MRRHLVAIAALVLLAGAGVASAQTVTPAASQLQPCRAGAGPAGACGGLCAVGYQCVYVPANNDCSCQVDAKVCATGVTGTEGYCAAAPPAAGSACAPAGRTFYCR